MSPWCLKTLVNRNLLNVCSLALILLFSMGEVSGNDTGICHSGLIQTSTVNVYASHHAREAEGGKGSFVFTRTGQLNKAVPVSYAIAGSARVSDYQPIPVKIRFEAGQSEKTLDIQAVNDGIKEQNETVSVTVIPKTGYVTGNHHSDSIQIIDNDSGAGQTGVTDNSPKQPAPDRVQDAGFFKPQVAGPVIQQRLNTQQLRPIPTVNNLGLLLMMLSMSWLAGVSSYRNQRPK